MKKSVIYLLLIATLIVASACLATTKRAPYSAIVPVVDYSDGVRNQAFSVAYKQVIANLSGNSKRVSSAETKEKLKDISVWVKSYHYTKQLPPEVSATLSTNDKQSLFLQVIFDPVSIPDDLQHNSFVNADTTLTDKNKVESPLLVTAIKSSANSVAQEKKINILNENEFSGLKANRLEHSPILMWLVVLTQDPKQNLLLDDSANNKVAQELKTAARHNDLSIILPAMDLEEITAINADDICSLDVKVIENAAKRYGAKNIVAGCVAAPAVTGSATTRHSEWLLLTEEKRTNWKIDGLDSGSILEQALEKVSVLLHEKKVLPVATIATISPPLVTSEVAPLSPPAATTFPAMPAVNNNVSPISPAPPTGETANCITLKVNNIDNLDQYAAVVKYLHTFSQITKIELLHISATTVELNITVAGGKSALVEILKTQQQLQASKDAKNSDSELNYNWTPKT